MIAGIVEVEIYINASKSLKEKRSVVKKILNKLREKFNLSVAETGYQDKWQRSLIAFACVGSSLRIVESTLEDALFFIEDNLDGFIINIEKNIF